MRGRRRIHDDSKARKRAYYQRNAQKERERAGARRRTRKQREAQREADVAAAAAETARLVSHLKGSAVILGPRLAITRAALWQLPPTLNYDLAGWRNADSDQEELGNIVDILLRALDAPCDEVIPHITQRRDIVSAVNTLARRAADFAWEHDADRAMMEGSLWSSFNELVDLTSHLLFCLDEIAFLFRNDHKELQCRVADKTLGIYSMF